MKESHKAFLIGCVGLVCMTVVVTLGVQVPKIIKAIKD